LKTKDKDKLLKNLEILQKDSDLERAHIMADQLLLLYIADSEITDAFEKIEKWYA
jgi:hypothetical protein